MARIEGAQCVVSFVGIVICCSPTRLFSMCLLSCSRFRTVSLDFIEKAINGL